MAQDERAVAGGRLAIGPGGDLTVGPADADEQSADEELPVGWDRVENLLDAGCPLLARLYGHGTHSRHRDLAWRRAPHLIWAMSPWAVVRMIPVGGLVLDRHTRRTGCRWRACGRDRLWGGGPARGSRTAQITRDEFGGMAANDGPVPVRTLAHAARLAREARQLPRYGIAAAEPTLDYVRLLARVDEVTEDVRAHSLLRDDVAAVGVAVYEEAGRAVRRPPRDPE